MTGRICKMFFMLLLVTAGIGLLCCGGCAAQPESLASRLQSQDPSVRIQAMVDAADSNDRQSLPYIVENLSSPESDVRFFAYIALKKITGLTMGYEFYGDSGQHQRAVMLWREWLKTGKVATMPATTSAPGCL
jgi:hypothetical protein